MRQTFLPFALPDTDQSEIDEIAEAIRSGWVTTGPKTRQFEAEFAAAVGARYAVAVNSCTAAMHLALEAVGLGRPPVGGQARSTLPSVGGQALVLTTPYTFAATAEVVRYFDAVPIFVDVEPDTLNMDPATRAETAEGLVNGGVGEGANGRIGEWANGRMGEGGEVKAVIPVHIAGLPADLDAIYQVAARHGLAVVEDAAHAFPARYQGRTIGGRPPVGHASHVPSSAVCFSFYATKTITTGEGGMLCTDDGALAERCRVMALHGISRDAWKRYTAEGSWYYEIVAPGYKYNMTDIAAAMGLAQLRKADRMWRRRRQIAERYNEAFGAMPELQIPADRADCQHAWHLYMLRLNLEALTLSRGEFIEGLKARNIGTSVHFIPLHLHPYYRETYGYRPGDFPVAYREYRRVVSLPIYSRMSDGDVEDVVEAVRALVGEYRAQRVFVMGGVGSGE